MAKGFSPFYLINDDQGIAPGVDLKAVPAVQDKDFSREQKFQIPGHKDGLER